MRYAFIIGMSLTVAVALAVNQAWSQGLDTEFEALPACRKLDAIAGSNKSVPEYIVGSGFDDFATDVVNDCPRHLVSLGKAWETLAADPDFDMFSRLSPCEQLNAAARDDKSVADFIAQSGYANFARPILEACPRHLAELGIAWERLNARGGPEVPPETPAPSSAPTPFDQLPRCEQLDVIEGTPGKSVVDHIFLSGIEDYADAVRSNCDRHLPALEAAERRAGVSNPSSNNLNTDFEKLAPCQKLDVIEGTGKSVPEYIAESGVEDFASDVYSMCRRHIDNLVEAQKSVEAANESPKTDF